MNAITTLALLAATVPGPSVGEVKLPLRDYIALVERIEAQSAAAAATRARAEAPVAELVAQRVVLTFADHGAELAATYDVEIRGSATAPVLLPLSGMASKVTVEPVGTAAVMKDAGGLSLVATAAGHYRVQVAGAATVAQKAGADSVTLAPMIAAVSELEVSIPAGRVWNCPGAVLADDTLKEGRRVLRLALPRGQAAVFETRRDVKPAEAPKALATAVLVTVVAVGHDGPRRHDVVLYEVARGEMGTMRLTLPEGVEPDRVVSDEGEVRPWIEGRELRVERTRKLAGTGYVAVVSQPVAKDAIVLAPVVVEPKVRARYLAVGSDVAAALTPTPEASWTRVDITDLPGAVRDAAGALGLVAAWRLRRDDLPGQLTITAMPSPKRLDGIVRSRSTMTLLTVEGTLLHRERLTIEGQGSAFEIGLPQDATLWSAQVNDVPVRPITREGRVVIPLGLASASGAHVEVVVVQPRAVAPGKSTLSLALPEIATPVLRHDWRLLLPQRNKYRYVSGDLGRAREGAAQQMGAPPAGGPVIAAAGGGSARISGKVLDPQGGVISGAMLVLVNGDTNRRLSVQTGASGEFAFLYLPSGRYTLTCSSPGFKTVELKRIGLGSGQERETGITLEVSAQQETIEVVSGDLPRLSQVAKAQRAQEEDVLSAQQAADFREQVGELKQGLVGGVRPIPVAIPETGKVLALAGVLPPARVTAELEVKAPKK